MNTIIEQMLAAYSEAEPLEKKDVVKEIMQEMVLCGLSRAGFFKSAAFYGGTALRIFYGLDRFSEDLDFSLKEKDENFDLSAFFPILEKEIASFGLRVEIAEKKKSVDSQRATPRSTFCFSMATKRFQALTPEKKSASSLRWTPIRPTTRVLNINTVCCPLLTKRHCTTPRLYSPEKSMPFSAGAGRTVSRGVTYTTMCFFSLAELR